MNASVQSEVLQKMPTGIEGFDEISGGGLPRHRTTLLAGGPGSGKTIFALNTLVNGARHFGEPGIFVAFEENSKQIFANSASFGWDLAGLVQKNLFFIDARMSSDVIQSGNFDLNALLAGVQAKADEMSATFGSTPGEKPVRIVFDAADVLLAHLKDPHAERQEVYRIHHWLEQNGYTGIITAKQSQSGGNRADQEYLQFMADCVIELKRTVQDTVSHRSLTIIKYRGSSFAESEFNLVIGPGGLEVPSLSIIDLGYPVSKERISTGVDQLDGMLNGGYLRGSSILITGSPGTAKSTLAGSFVNAACQRGESALYVSFDEGPEEILRNMTSVNLHLKQHLDGGYLCLYSSRAEARSAIEHLVEIKRLIRERKPTCVVIDPLSSMEKAGGEQLAKTMAQRLIYETKAQGITLLMTSLLAAKEPEIEATPIEISAIADTWIHLSYIIQSGERNRALTIVKSRGTRHSNQVRELVLSDNGIALTEVYFAGGQVLMGTLRFEKEAAERERQIQYQIEQTRRRRELEVRRAAALAQMESLRKQIEASDEELASFYQEANRQEEQLFIDSATVRQMRGGDGSEDSGAASTQE